MDKRHVARIAAELGLPEVPENWSGIDAVWPLLERMRSDGATVLVKIDGERGPGDSGPYTAHVSRGRLGDGWVRTDEHSLEAALTHVIVRYAADGWGLPLPA